MIKYFNEVENSLEMPNIITPWCMCEGYGSRSVRKKKRDKVKKKWNSSKFWTKNRDCPSKSGIVKGYIYACLTYIYVVQMQFYFTFP